MPNRVVCDVLKEMRKCYETRNFSYLPGLIEEAQTMVNRMEARLEDYKDADKLNPGELRKEIRNLTTTRNQLKREISDLELARVEVKCE